MLELKNGRTLMKNLVIVSLLAAASSLSTGCIISSDDDGSSPCGDEELNGGACLDIIVVCPPDATGFTVSGLVAAESEDCGVGEIPVLVDAGTYDLTVTPEAPDIDLASDGDTVTLGEGDTVQIVFDTWPLGGFMTMTWTIDDEDPAAGGCADLSSGGVSSLATVVGSSEAYEDLFDCEAGFGFTSETPLDDYTVVFSLLDQDDLSIADSTEQSVSLLSEDELVDLGNFNFVTI
jgi:hypothetical protein